MNMHAGEIQWKDQSISIPPLLIYLTNIIAEIGSTKTVVPDITSRVSVPASFPFTQTFHSPSGI
jgi:hypothetical protein